MSKTLSAKQVKAMELGYPEDKRPKLEVETEKLGANVEQIEKLIVKARFKLSAVSIKSENSVPESKYHEDPAESALVAILREKNVRLTNIASQLESIINSVQL